MSLAIKSAFAALAISAALLPTADAQTPRTPGSVTVAYSDLAISTAADSEILLRRIQSAATKACNQVVPHSPLSPRALSFCRRDAVEQAVRHMGMPTLTAAWSGNHPSTIASR